ncbi:unnamed protein product, partial [Ectocarpus sp. 8 AP-2014]
CSVLLRGARKKTSFFESVHADVSSCKQAKNVEKADAAFCCVFARRVPALSWFRNKRFLLAR